MMIPGTIFDFLMISGGSKNKIGRKLVISYALHYNWQQEFILTIHVLGYIGKHD